MIAVAGGRSRVDATPDRACGVEPLADLSPAQSDCSCQAQGLVCGEDDIDACINHYEALCASRSISGCTGTASTQIGAFLPTYGASWSLRCGTVLGPRHSKCRRQWHPHNVDPLPWRSTTSFRYQQQAKMALSGLSRKAGCRLRSARVGKKMAQSLRTAEKDDEEKLRFEGKCPIVVRQRECPSAGSSSRGTMSTLLAEGLRLKLPTVSCGRVQRFGTVRMKEGWVFGKWVSSGRF